MKLCQIHKYDVSNPLPKKGREPRKPLLPCLRSQPHFFFKKNKSKGPIDSKILVDQNLEVLVI